MDDRGMLEMNAEGGVAALVSPEVVGQQMRLGGNIKFEEGAKFGGGDLWQDGNLDAPCTRAVLACRSFAAIVPECQHLRNGGDKQALIWTSPAADKSFVGFQQAIHRTREIFTQSAAQLVCGGPSRLIGYVQFAARKFCGHPRACGPTSRKRREITSVRLSGADEGPCLRPLAPNNRKRVRKSASASSCLAAHPCFRSLTNSRILAVFPSDNGERVL